MTEEIYHLQIEGEQRGPYTRRQIDHQLNSGLIREDALFVQEGMEEWAPITNLVALRRPRRRWRFRGVLIAFLCFLVVIGRFLGPVAVDGWREYAQFQYTGQAAYWRARDAVRHRALPQHALVRFSSFAHAQAVLDAATAGAQVRLVGDVTTNSGHIHPAAWQVALSFDHEAKQWTARSVKEEAGVVPRD